MYKLSLLNIDSHDNSSEVRSFMNFTKPFPLLLLPVIDLAVWARTRRQDGEHQPLLRQLGLIQHLHQSETSIVTNQRQVL